MKRLLVFLTGLAVSFVMVPSVAYAAKAVGSAGSGGSKPAPVVELKGYDVSYPQCGKTLPTDHYFAVVGVNGGTAAVANSCLGEQLVWANRAKTGSKQPRVQLYVNTANPGEVISQITTWPTTPNDAN